MAGLRVLTFDLEIILSPTDHPQGWEGARRGECGVSCVAVHDDVIERTLLYNEHDLEECVEHLNDADLLITFNGIEFDTPCLESITGYSILPPQYDILREVWKALGKRQKGYRLGEICERLGLGAKTSDGKRATDMYRDGDFYHLYSYCRNDVKLTRRLADFINENGYILTPDGDELPMPRPMET
jgi:uncharacterized protein YprB with RNaseH-like and TPR domain